MQFEFYKKQSSLAKTYLAIAFTSIVFGFSYEYINWFIFLPALLLLTPVKDEYTTKLVNLNVLTLIPLNLAMDVFGHPKFVNGIPTYFQEIFFWLSPLVFCLLFICQGKFSKQLLFILIPSALLLPPLYFLSFIVFLIHPYKWPRRITALLSIPICLIGMLLALFGAFWNQSYLSTNKIVTEELIRTVESNGDEINVYLTNYAGAAGRFGILIRREHKFLPGIILLKDSVSFNNANHADLKLLKNNRVWYRVHSNTGVI